MDIRVGENAFITVEPNKVFVPLTSAVTPFDGIPVLSTGRPSLLLVVTGASYGEVKPHLRCTHHPIDSTHGMELLCSPNTVPTIVGQLLAGAQVAGWDMPKLSEDLNKAQTLADAQFRDLAASHPHPFGTRLR